MHADHSTVRFLSAELPVPEKPFQIYLRACRKHGFTRCDVITFFAFWVPGLPIAEKPLQIHLGFHHRAVLLHGIFNWLCAPIWVGTRALSCCALDWTVTRTHWDWIRSVEGVRCEGYTNSHGSGLPVPEKSALCTNLIASRAFSHAGNNEYTRMHRVRGLIICDTRGLR